MEVPAAMLAVQVITPAALCSGKFCRAAAPLWPPGRMLMKYGAWPPRKAMAARVHFRQPFDQNKEESDKRSVHRPLADPPTGWH